MSFELTLSFTDPRGERRAEVVRAPRYTIGRAPGNDLALNFEKLSRIHAVIETTGAGARLSDCGSRNGTLVNGRYINDPVELRDGDTITLGNACDLRVSLRPGAQDAHALPPPPTAREAAFYERSFDDVLLEPRRPARPQAPPATYAPAAPPRHEAHAAPGLPPTAQAHAPAAKSGALPPWLARYALVLAVPCVVLLAASLLLYVFTRNRDSRNVGAGGDAPEVSRDNSSEREPEPERDGRHETAPPADDSKGVGRANDAADSPGDARSADAASAGGSSSPGGASSPSGGAVSDEQLAQAVRRVMSSMSTADNAPYLPESGVRDVAAKVRSYGASPSALAERLRAARRACADVNAQAQRINLRPPLLMYAALAESEGGADPAAAARQMSQKLLTLRATFGTDTANSALLLLAAYPYPFNPPIGTQQRTVHPLYAELIRTGGQRSRVDPAVARTVWFLREQGSLRADAYELVVRTLAIGVIAQNPQRYGVNADPLLC